MKHIEPMRYKIEAITLRKKLTAMHLNRQPGKVTLAHSVISAMVKVADPIL